MRRSLRWMALMSSVALVLTMAAGCGGSGGKSSKSKSKGHQGGTFTILATHPPSGGPDPAINYTLQLWQLSIDTHDGLVAFKRAGGTEGTKIVADLAEAVPKPTNGGKTWKFKVRRNIKYSDGTTMKPSDFKRTLERMFMVKGPTGGSFYQVFVGADKCLKTPATCDLSAAIVPDDKNYTLTFHLTGSDPEFLDKLAVPFAFVLPPSTPMKEVTLPPPGTGPYKFVEYSSRKQMKLVRNPFFKEWSKDAQPNGNPDTIVEKFGLTVEAEVTQIENGQADALSGADQVPADRLPELSSTKYSSQVHVNPLTAVWYMAFNVRIPPFNNLKARQGVNFATDHNALVKIYGGPKLAQPTCQILPPNFPGYEPYCPYTKNPGAKWSAPDLAKAQQLIAASGTKGAPVKVNTDTNEVDKAIGLYFVGLLNKLGYKAELQALSSDIQYTFCQNSKNKVQFCFSSWYQDYPAASDFLNVLLGCASFVPNSDANPNISEFCDKSTQAKIDQALKTGLTDPTKANKIWAQVDKDVVDKAAWTPIFNPKFVDLLSKRVKGYLFSPQWYFLIDQASVQ